MILTLEHLSKSYDGPVLKDISATFESGKLYVIKGISGCGKTTLLNILGGVDREFGGRISVSPEKGKAVCRYIFQQSLLLSRLTLLDNLRLVTADRAQIERGAERYGIAGLMDHFPEQLSGGERQRASILRAQLAHPDILLADEPTASLDDSNSRRIAADLAALKSHEKIIIIATHEDYFDGYADEIFDLTYGTISRREPADGTAEPAACGADQDAESGSDRQVKGGKTSSGLTDFAYIRKRREGFASFKKIWLFAVCFFMIFAVSAAQKNLTPEAMRLYREGHPVDLIKLPTRTVPYMTDDDLSHVTVYENLYAEENGITAYYLLPKEYSVLAMDGVLAAGRFPEEESEILINQSLAQSLTEREEDISSVLGQEISFCSLNLRISGIVGSYGGDFRSDAYYAYDKNNRPLKETDHHLFLAYPLLLKIGQSKEWLFTMMTCPGLWDDPELQESLSGYLSPEESLNNYLSEIRKMQQQADLIARIILFVLLILFGIACLFMISTIRLELFYRRKEMGYLQIFGLKKSRILRVILLEYGTQLLLALLAAFLAFGILSALYAFIMKSKLLWPDAENSLLFGSGIILLYLLTVLGTSLAFLRQSVLKLIQ